MLLPATTCESHQLSASICRPASSWSMIRSSKKIGPPTRRPIVPPTRCLYKEIFGHNSPSRLPAFHLVLGNQPVNIRLHISPVNANDARRRRLEVGGPVDSALRLQSFASRLLCRSRFRPHLQLTTSARLINSPPSTIM
jgi:hypothetical protein